MNLINNSIMWMYTGACIVVIVLAATRAGLRAKFWLIAFASGNLVGSLIWRIPTLLLRLNLIEPEAWKVFYQSYVLIMNIFNVLIFCLLIPYILLAPAPKTINEVADGSHPPGSSNPYQN
jgi:hypothetical protein